MPQDTPSRKLDQYPLRLPDGMRDRLKTEAKRNGRSMNAEIVARLEATFSDPIAHHAVSGDVSLRDWFAGQALAGLCTAQSQEGEWQTIPSGAATAAYAYADAMLAQREKR